ncbi:IclR family transcriptional regulator [Pseudonocardia zijingensis]|jgi:IclR family acetate operon transcriptional repressor|uniref:IclR family transcriptional regulator n=2 Tax=Pseudonocardia zijingensis TaxID=153376 RepID=A0ABP4B1N4_9PSEU
MRILEALALPDGPHRLMDVAEHAAVPRSTAYRVLATLTAEGFAENCGEGRYGVGGRLSGLGARIVSAMSAGVGPALHRLQQGAGGNTVHLAVRVGDHAVYLHKVDSDKPYEMRSRVGHELRLHCTAIGKAILAHLPRDEVEAVMASAGMPSRTPATITDLPALHAELAAVREHGYALDDEENEPTVRCLGAAVLDRTGRPRGGVSISTVTFAVDREELLSYVPLLQDTVHAITDLI